MQQRPLGIDGPTLSVIGLGCNNFGMRLDRSASSAVVHAAIEAGITHLDTAEMYGQGKSEEYVGAAIAQCRDSVTVATKYLPRPKDEPYTPGALRQHIIGGCERSLRRLGTDRIDLYYQHFPDPAAPVEEALEAFDELVSSGKVLHIASSNVTASQIRAAATAAAHSAGTRYCGTQLEWNLLNREAEHEVIPAARGEKMGLIPYFPLASGMLTGKYRRGHEYPAGSRLQTVPYFADRFANDANFDSLEIFTAFAEERDHTVLDLAIAWLAAQEGVASVIAGATTPEQVRTNAGAATWTLTSADLAALP